MKPREIIITLGVNRGKILKVKLELVDWLTLEHKEKNGLMKREKHGKRIGKRRQQIGRGKEVLMKNLHIKRSDLENHRFYLFKMTQMSNLFIDKKITTPCIH